MVQGCSSRCWQLECGHRARVFSSPTLGKNALVHRHIMHRAPQRLSGQHRRGLARPQHEHEDDKGIESARLPQSVACAAMAVVEQRSAACAAAPCRRAAWACGGVPFLGHEKRLLEWQEMSEPPLAGRWQIGSDERLGTSR